MVSDNVDEEFKLPASLNKTGRNHFRSSDLLGILNSRRLNKSGIILGGP